MKILKREKSCLTAFIKRVIAPISGKMRFQKIFEVLYLISLEGMNIGMISPGYTEPVGIRETNAKYFNLRLAMLS